VAAALKMSVGKNFTTRFMQASNQAQAFHANQHDASLSRYIPNGIFASAHILKRWTPLFPFLLAPQQRMTLLWRMEFLRTLHASSLLWPLLAVSIWFAIRIQDLWTARLVKGVIVILFALLLAPYYHLADHVSRWPGILSLSGLVVAAILRRKIENKNSAGPLDFFMVCALIASGYLFLGEEMTPRATEIIRFGLLPFLFAAAVDAIAAARKSEGVNARFLKGVGAAAVLAACVFPLLNGRNADFMFIGAPIAASGLLTLAFIRSNAHLRAAAVVASGALALASWSKVGDMLPAMRAAFFLAPFGAGLFFADWKALKENKKLIRSAALHGLAVVAVIVLDLLFGGVIRGNGVLAAACYILAGLSCGFAVQSALALIQQKSWPPGIAHAPAAGAIVAGIGLLTGAILLSDTSFRAFDRTARGLFFQPGAKIEAIRDLTKPYEGANMQVITDDAMLLFDGVVTLPSPVGDSELLRIACLPENKAICADGKPLYVWPREVWSANFVPDLASGSDKFTVYLTEDPAEIERALFTRDFLWGKAPPDRVKPDAFEPRFFGGYFHYQPDTARKAAKILELTALLLIAPEGKTENAFYAHVPRLYAPLMKREIFPPSIRDLLTKGAEEIVKTLVSDFPFSANTWPGLAAAFNEMPGPARLAIAEQILRGIAARNPEEEKVLYGTKDGCDECDHEDTYIHLAMKNGLPGRVALDKKVGRNRKDRQDEEGLNIQQIKALPLPDGLALEFTVENAKLTLEPVGRAEYLLRGGPAIQELVRDVPRDAPSIRNYLDGTDLDEYKRNLVRVVLANLEGGYSKEKGEMVYNLSMNRPQDFWIAHAIISRHPSLTREHDWKGSFKDQYFGFPMGAYHCGGPDPGNYVEPTSAWYKPQEKEFRLVYNGGCAGSNDVVCFSDTGPGFEFTFKTTEIKSQKPAISMRITENATECEFLNRLLPGG
jgi:hypothetical protein